MIEDRVIIGYDRTFEELFAMEDWLKSKLGLPALSSDHVDTTLNKRWVTVREFDHHVFYFASKDDAMWFKMSFDYD